MTKRDCQDRKVWRDDVEGQFYVKSSYFVLYNREQGRATLFSKHFGT